MLKLILSSCCDIPVPLPQAPPPPPTCHTHRHLQFVLYGRHETRHQPGWRRSQLCSNHVKTFQWPSTASMSECQGYMTAITGTDAGASGSVCVDSFLFLKELNS